MKSAINQCNNVPQSGADIEAASFLRIDTEAPPHAYDARQWIVVRRMIHATADFDFADITRFTPGAVMQGIQALKNGSKIYADSNMIRAGISLERLGSVYPGYRPDSIRCHVADPDVHTLSKQTQKPRSLFAVQKARPHLENAVVMIGNSPVALLELCRLIREENLRPALVVGVPVGFVHVEESKQELCRLDVPSITTEGRKGGSPVAVSILHALCTLASQNAEES